MTQSQDGVQSLLSSELHLCTRVFAFEDEQSDRGLIIVVFSRLACNYDGGITKFSWIYRHTGKSCSYIRQ
jgi:hypothetical protein